MSTVRPHLPGPSRVLKHAPPPHTITRPHHYPPPPHTHTLTHEYVHICWVHPAVLTRAPASGTNGANAVRLILQAGRQARWVHMYAGWVPVRVGWAPMHAGWVRMHAGWVHGGRARARGWAHMHTG